MKRVLLVSAFLLALCIPSSAQFNGCAAGFCAPKVTGGGPSGWCAAIPQSGLVNCWPFDSTYTTSSAATDPISGSNLTLANITLNGSGPTGSANLNNAIVCNGSTSHGDNTSGPSTKTMLSGSAWTINFWVNGPFNGNGSRMVANDHTDNDNAGFEFYNTGTSQVSLDLGTGSANTFVNVGGLTSSTWTMITFVLSSGTVTQYVNGSSLGTTSFTPPVTSGSNQVGVCYNPAYNGDFAAFKMAGIAWWNVALSSVQIATMNGL